MARQSQKHAQGIQSNNNALFQLTSKRNRQESSDEDDIVNPPRDSRSIATSATCPSSTPPASFWTQLHVPPRVKQRVTWGTMRWTLKPAWQSTNAVRQRHIGNNQHQRVYLLLIQFQKASQLQHMTKNLLVHTSEANQFSVCLIIQASASRICCHVTITLVRSPSCHAIPPHWVVQWMLVK